MRTPLIDVFFLKRKHGKKIERYIIPYLYLISIKESNFNLCPTSYFRYLPFGKGKLNFAT